MADNRPQRVANSRPKYPASVSRMPGWGSFHAEDRAAVPALKGPRLPTVRELISKLRPVYERASGHAVREHLAAVLRELHRESHAVYKPDEIARSNATRIYRERNKPADYAARERVVYPTTAAHRDAIVRTGNLP